MRVIYVDILFLLNLAVNYLILLATAKIAAVYINRLKILLGAALGGAYAVAAALMAQPPLHSIWFKIGAAVLMLLVCFGRERGLLRITLIFFAVSAAFGGIVLAVSLIGGGGAHEAIVPVSLKVLLPSFAVSYAVIALIFKKLGRRRPGGFAKIAIKNAGKKTEFISLIDTGNSLTDPIGGGKVVIAEVEALAPLFSPNVLDTLRSEMSSTQMLEKLSGCDIAFRLIPYSAVGLKRGLLLAFKPESVTVNGKDETGMLVAISPTRLSEGGLYSAIVGSEFMEVRA